MEKEKKQPPRKKTTKEIEAQLSLLRWLMAQPSPRAAIEKAHKLLTDLQFDGSKIEVEKDEVYDADFLEFWAVYPKRVGKGDAYRKWKSQVKSKKQKERIIQSVEKHKHCDRWLAEDGKFIPNPATFLHQRRFDDDVVTIEEEEVQKSKPKFRYELDKERNTMVQIPVDND